MNKPPILWSQQARDEVVDIYKFIAGDNKAAAEALIARIQEAATLLAEYPLKGRKGRDPRTRELVLAGTAYLLVYTFDGREISILRCLHGARRR